MLDLESRASQEANPVAVREVKLDARVARPFDAADAEREVDVLHLELARVTAVGPMSAPWRAESRLCGHLGAVAQVAQPDGSASQIRGDSPPAAHRERAESC